MATERHTDLAALGVGASGLDDAARSIEVDERCRVAEGFWAIGDVTGKGVFTHVSIYQAWLAAADILGRDGERADYWALPRVTFTDPEIGAVGYTEADAREHGIRVRTRLLASARGWIHQAGNHGLIKLVKDANSGTLVGATSVGFVGGEVPSGLAVAVHADVPARLAGADDLCVSDLPSRCRGRAEHTEPGAPRETVRPVTPKDQRPAPARPPVLPPRTGGRHRLW